MDLFDPYQHWLGIPSQVRPLNHYILLGVRIFESDSKKIATAYDARMKLLKKFQSGPRGELSAQLIEKIGKAKLVLLAQGYESKYDITLRQSLEARQRQLDQVGDESGDSEVEAAQELPAESKSTSRVSFPVGADTEAEVTSPLPVLSLAALPATESVGKDDPVDDHTEDDSEVLSPFSLLTDIRYFVALLVLSIIIMTVTLKLLSPDKVPQVAKNSSEQLLVKTDVGPVVAAPVDSNAGLARVEQAKDGSFELPINRAGLTGTDLKLGANGVTGWSAGDQVAWVLVVDDRRNGYFNCRIMYRAKAESTFEIQLGKRNPRSFTIYRHKDDFEEEFIVRLAQASEETNEQVCRIKCVLGGASETEVKRIRLAPNR